MDRIIPTTMASQHPDHAAKPWWHTKEFISTRQEVRECFLTFSELGISEYKWDWEGKFVDESVTEKLLGEHFEYFQHHPLGKEKFLTFRLPNPKVETEFRLGRAFMVMLAASSLAQHLGLYNRPLFEVILPMTESAQEMIDIQEAYAELGGLKHSLYNMSSDSMRHIEVIPLFEEVNTIMHSDDILKEYVDKHVEKFGFKPEYLRPYVARSDPALNAGLVSTVLAIKYGLSRYRRFEADHGIRLYPIIGSASLPFRGGLTPHNAADFAHEYRGVRTALIQSAFRYDYPLKDVIKGIEVLADMLPKAKAVEISASNEKKIEQIVTLFKKPYRESIEGIASVINEVASCLPKRRERVQHVGLFGYSRGVGAVRLPRAITFTGALYSLGVPPELIGTGRGLALAEKSGLLETVETYYVNIKSDLRRAGRYLNKEALAVLAQISPHWQDIQEDVRCIETYLGEDLGPKTPEEMEHAQLTMFIASNLEQVKTLGEQLAKAALLRKSLG
jgi:phosphoenolpyruvate carboxylase